MLKTQTSAVQEVPINVNRNLRFSFGVSHVFCGPPLRYRESTGPNGSYRDLKNVKTTTANMRRNKISSGRFGFLLLRSWISQTSVNCGLSANVLVIMGIMRVQCRIAAKT